MPQVVVVEGLTKHFGGGRGVSDVSFEIGAGEVFGFLGPNGAGKSTTIRLLLGLYLPTAGRMRVFGLDPARDERRDPPPRRVPARRAGAVPAPDRPPAPGPVLPRARSEGPALPRRTGRAVHRRAGPAGPRIVERQPAEDRHGSGVHAPARSAGAGRADLRPGPVAARRVPDRWSARRSPKAAPSCCPPMSSTRSSGSSTGVAIIKDGSIVVTDTVDGLRRAAPRTVEFQFATRVDPEMFGGLDGSVSCIARMGASPCPSAAGWAHCCAEQASWIRRRCQPAPPTSTSCS